MDSAIKIRELHKLDSIEELTIFLNASYATLADMGFRYTATWQGDDITIKRIENGVCLIAELEGAIVGTVTYYGPGSREYPPEYAQEGVAAFGQLGVKVEQRGAGLGRLLVLRCEELAKADGACKIMLDTAEPAVHLIEWYEKMGYEVIASADWDSTNYKSVIMSKRLAESK